jgi:hypothetical protein
MAFNWKLIRKKLYGIIKAPGRGLVKLPMYDEQGRETLEPTKANRFLPTFESKSADLETFTVLVAIRDEGQSSHVDIKTPEIKDDRDFEMVKKLIGHIRLAVGQREGIKVNWQDFDKAIDPREEAVNNIKESKDVSKVFGTTKSSFQRIGDAKLIIRHTETVNEEKHGARTRHIRALFVENRLGERFAYPHLHMAGARAFARHISNGGTNHDAVAQKIFSLSEDYSSLRRSKNELRLFEGASTWVLSIRESMDAINRRLKSMHGPKGYATATQELLDESAVVDLAAIERLHETLAKTCGCDQEDPRYGDFGKAASYIVKTPQPELTPMTFSWNRQPDLSTAVQPSAAERMYHQIMELADACSDARVSARLSEIAEMISNGDEPCESDLAMVKEAFASGMSFIPRESSMPEEVELEEFLSSYSLESIFSEDAEQDEVSDLESTGMDSADAEQEAHDTMSEAERQIYIPGIPGEIIDRVGEYVLMHDEDDYGDVVKHEYDVYQQQGSGWKHIENINEPYDRRGNIAIEKFRTKYGSTAEPSVAEHDAMSEWDEDPDHLDSQRAEATEANIELHLKELGVTAPITMAQAHNYAGSIEKLYLGISSDDVMDYMETHGMIMSEEGSVNEVSFLTRLRNLAGI